jgi:ribose 5-phosphate isomerase A
MMSNGENFKSDNGNLMLDCRFADGIKEPAQLEAELQARAGVVESGLFLKVADVAILGTDSGPIELDRKS